MHRGARWPLALYPGRPDSIGAQTCPLDPCIFCWYDEKKDLCGIVAVHVDDARIAGNRQWYNEIFPEINNLYMWGSWDEDNYKYTGVTYNGRTGENVAYHYVIILTRSLTWT